MAVDIYFPALSSNTFSEGPSGYYTFPITLTENPPGSGLYDIPGYLLPDGVDLYSVPLDLLGAAEAGTSNLKMFAVQEDATPIDPSSSAGGVGQITVGMDDFPDAPRLIGEIVLTDGSRGKTSGTVRSLSVSDGALSIVADSVLGKFNTERIAQPFIGDLGDAIQYYCDLVGVQNDVFVDTTVSSRPVVYPGWVGNAWVYMKQLLAVEQVEMALVFDRVYVRPLRQLIANQDKLTSNGWSLDNASAAHKVEVYYYNHVSGNQLEVFPLRTQDDPPPYTVNAGETITVTQQLEASLSLVNQPTCIDFVNDASYAGTGGVYSVVGNDNLPVPSAQWVAQGGKIEVRITDDPSIIEIQITGASMMDYSPYRIAMSAGSGSDYNSLHITGTGVTWNKKLVTLRTGATTATTSTEVGVTVDNPFLTSKQQAYSLGLLTAGSYAGVNYKISGSALDLNRNGDGDALVQATIADFNLATLPGTPISDFNTLWAGQQIYDFNVYWDEQIKALWSNQLFGNAPGARVLEKEANFRITSATTTESTVQFSAELDTLVKDFNSKWPEDGTVTVLTNHVTDPSVRNMSTAGTVRTNYNPNPLPNSGTGYARAGAVASTLTYETAGGPTESGGKWIKSAITASGTDNQIQIAQVAQPLVRGVSAWVFSSKAGNYNFKAWTYNGAGTYLGVGNDITSSTFALAANTWTFVNFSLTQPATAYSRFIMFLRPNGISLASGDTYGVALWTASDGYAPNPMATILGSAAAGGDFTYAWSGTAHASTSLQRAPGFSYVGSEMTAYSGGNATRWGSTTEGVNTPTSAAFLKYNTSASGYIWSLPAAAAIGNTVSVRAKVKAPVGAAYSWSIRNGTGGGTNTVTTVGNGDWQEVGTSAVATASTGAGSLVGVQVTSTSGPGTLYYIDEIVMTNELTEYAGPYFDGSVPDVHSGGTTTDYAWTGAPDASTSTRTITTNDYRISDFNAQFAGMTMKDYAVVPLRKEF